MKPAAHLIILAALATPVYAQTHAEPRASRSGLAPSTSAFETAPVDATGVSSLPDGAVPAVAPIQRLASGGERARFARPELDRVHYTTQPDGSTWASGRTYKAGFGPDGAIYVPFLGSQAPRNFPLAMSLAAASVDGASIPLTPAGAAVRDGDRIVIDRGPIDEVYELALDSIEQTFVVAERPAAGDLRLVVRLECEMSRSESAAGVTWSNEHGAVNYSRAFVREGGGDRVPLESRLVGGGVEIVVPGAYLAQARFPLIVDPVVTTYVVSDSVQDTWDSDVAYDLTTDRYLTVYEHNFSQSDGDIHAVLREASFSHTYFALLDNTPENWRAPQCANLNSANQFLMVAQAANVQGLTNWNIWGRTIDAVSFVPGPKTLISTSDQPGPKYMPDVGGDPSEGPGPAYYCVTWRRDFSITDWSIHARLVTAQGTLVGAQTLSIEGSAGSSNSAPSISKSNGRAGGAGAWTVAWHRENSSVDYEVLVARVSWDGQLEGASVQLTSAFGYEYFPRVSSPLVDGRVLIVYGVDQGPHDDIHYALMTGLTPVLSGSLTALDAPATLQRNQIEYSVDSDGDRFVVAYAENFGTSTFDYNVWISTFVTSGVSLLVSEARALLDNGPAQSLRTDVVAKRSGGAIGSPRCFVSWDSTGNGGHDVYAALYDCPAGGATSTYCYGDGTTLSCPCGDNSGFQTGCPNSANSFGARLETIGLAQSGFADDLSFRSSGAPPNVTCTLFQGTDGDGAVPFGDGVRCVFGAQVRIRTKFADAFGAAAWPSGSEPDVSVTGQIPASGGQRFYQVLYRNAAAFCTPATFNTTNGVRVSWLP